MNTTPRRLVTLAAAAMAFSLVNVTHAAQVSFSGKAPTPGPNDISNLKGADTENKNVSKGDHDATYIADDRPVQGQTFTTGTNAAGYQLKAVACCEVEHDTFALVPDLKYSIRITKPSGRMLEVLATEIAEVPAAFPGNFLTIAEGQGMGSGSGRFITFTFDKPVMLKPTTTYGFDVGGGDTRHYWQMNGTVSNSYSGGEAYSSGRAGMGSDTLTTRSGDHVFVAALVPVTASVADQAQAPAKIKAANP